jgi:hypothetical protein
MRYRRIIKFLDQLKTMMILQTFVFVDWHKLSNIHHWQSGAIARPIGMPGGREYEQMSKFVEFALSLP